MFFFSFFSDKTHQLLISFQVCIFYQVAFKFHEFNSFWLKFNKFFIAETDVKNEDVKIRDLAADEFDEMYACEYCDQVFINSSDLLEHRETHAELHDDPTKYMEDSS